MRPGSTAAAAAKTGMTSWPPLLQRWGGVPCGCHSVVSREGTLKRQLFARRRELGMHGLRLSQ